MSDLTLPSTNDPERSLTSADKAAIILSLLDPSDAREVAVRFDEGRIERAIQAFENLRMVSQEEVVAIVEDYLAALEGDVPVVAGGRLRASELAEALTASSGDGDDSAQSGPLIAHDATPDEIWDYVGSLEPQALIQLLEAERASVITAVLRRLDRGTAADLLGALPPEKAGEVARLLVEGAAPTGRTYDAIAQSLRKSAPERLNPNQAGQATPKSLAAIFNQLPGERQDRLLDPLRAELPEAMAEVDEHLINFATLHTRLPRTVAPMLFRELDNKLLDTAFKHALSAQPETAEFMLASISQRLAEQIRERIEDSPPVTESDGEAAQAQIMRTLLAWADEDRFAFKMPGEDD